MLYKRYKVFDFSHTYGSRDESFALPLVSLALSSQQLIFIENDERSKCAWYPSQASKNRHN